MIRRVRHPASAATALLTISLLSAACNHDPTDPGPATGGSGRVLGVPYIPQQTQTWCWAASTQMVLSYYRGNITSQCQIVSRFFPYDCCVYPGYCVQGPPDLTTPQVVLNAYGIGSQRTYSAVSFDVVRQELDAGRPLILAYGNSFAGHAVVLYGYDALGRVDIYDPYFGVYTGLPFGTTFSYGNFRWSDTLIGIR